MILLEQLKSIGVTEHYLPELCYSTTEHPPRLLETVRGMVTHGFSAKNINFGLRFDKEMCWNLMRDLNYPRKDRLYIQRIPGLDDDDRSYASATFMFYRDGDCEILVPLDRQAFHAGISEWKGMVGLNEYMLGAEFVGAEGEAYTDEQYIMGGMVYAMVMNYYGLTLDDIPGHYQVSPGRKTDPWPETDTKPGWEWDRLHDEIDKHLMNDYEGAT